MQKKWIAGLMAAVLVPAAVFAAGVSQNEVVYNAKNESVKRTYKEPVKEGAEFLGWATTKEKADAGEVDFRADPEDPSNTDLNQIEGGTKTVYAAWWPYNAKWAVALYGIDQDMEKMGGGTYTHTMTFGPATGLPLITESQPAHITLANETDSNKCIHNHSWDEVIALCKTNPHVFDQCVESGCTKTVNLSINDTLRNDQWKNEYAIHEAGDGPSILKNELHNEFRVWQPGDDNTGGYPASRIRAVLNGYDWTSDDSHGNTTDNTKANVDNITSDNCLLSCFSENLQKAIVPKAVRSDTVYNNYFGNNATTWDKLWLFSGEELYQLGTAGDRNCDRVFRYEGTNYDRSKKLAITAVSVDQVMYSQKGKWNQGFAASPAFDGNPMELGGMQSSWWLRSLPYWYKTRCYSVFYIYGAVDDHIETGSDIPGIAPGFVIGQ